MKNISNWIAVLVLLFACISTTYSHASELKRPRSFYENQGSAVWEVPNPSKSVAITFDDGPSETYTPEILDLLAKYDAKATFFVMGSRAEENPEVIRQTALAGHEIANHTYSHGNIPRMSTTEIKEDLNRTNDVIEGITNTSTTLFRPPGGYYDTRIINAVNEEGYTFVLWSWHQDTYDWKQPGAGKIVANVLTKVQNGDIILFHDGGGDRSQTVQALKKILPELKKRGYQLVTVSELMRMDPRYQYLKELNVEETWN
ncbi:polysaccharide deacetylase family protein [Bacillus sp. SB49]|uniref:polysaccharide deacetylase family protein n=1 Tax=Bacillaceae TaxID=186817 RepID=UPI0002A50083|nr:MULTISPECIES: polysaccharide deacetylase family protein [Bacillaceae]ELK45604.1 polysaccharide deacetylase family sporulation protein PdaB [Halobacillus sp. BAB-2008]QHT46082.1 polysaccharide deacetylase family protein [Bacillus sp. SB49]